VCVCVCVEVLCVSVCVVHVVFVCVVCFVCVCVCVSDQPKYGPKSTKRVKMVRQLYVQNIMYVFTVTFVSTFDAASSPRQRS
jgi:hypothetical protein